MQYTVYTTKHQMSNPRRAHSEGVQVQDLAKEGRRAARSRRGVQVTGGGPERDAVLLAVYPDGGDQHAEAQEHLLSPA